MALQKRGQWWYGDTHHDIRDELVRYGTLSGYPPTQFAEPACGCGSTMFRLRIDDNEGAAVRTCTVCGTVHPIGDSDEYLDDAELEEVACVCGGETFEIAVGVSLYAQSDDVRWLYIGCRCPACGLTACFGDWKNEFLNYRKLLDRV